MKPAVNFKGGYMRSIPRISVFRQKIPRIKKGFPPGRSSSAAAGRYDFFNIAIYDKSPAPQLRLSLFRRNIK